MSEIKVTPRGFKAPLMHPCMNNRCDGRMQLVAVDKNKQALDDPYYLCQNAGCYYHRNEVYPRDMGSRFFTEPDKKRVRNRSSEGLLPGEGLTAL